MLKPKCSLGDVTRPWAASELALRAIASTVSTGRRSAYERGVRVASMTSNPRETMKYWVRAGAHGLVGWPSIAHVPQPVHAARRHRRPRDGWRRASRAAEVVPLSAVGQNVTCGMAS